MKRVRGVLALHGALHGTPGRPAQHVSDVLRGALVLAVGSLDGLVLEATIEAIAPVARADGLGDQYSRWLKEDPATFWRLIGDRDRCEAIADLGRAKLSTVTFQKASMIEGVLRDVAGCEAPWAAASERLSRGVITLTPEGVRTHLDGVGNDHQTWPHFRAQ